MANPVTSVVGRASEEGNACRVDFVFPSDAVRLRVLRRVGVNPTGPTDPAAVVVSDGPPQHYLSTDLQGSAAYFVDQGFQTPASGQPAALVNGTAYHYGLFAHDGSAYSVGAFVALVPELRVTYAEPDVKSILIRRLETSMRVLAAAGGYAFRPTAEIGGIVVYSTYPRIGEVTFPLVSVHRDGDAEAERWLGDGLGEQVVSIGGETRHETNLGRVRRIRFAVLGWSQDPGERDELSRLMTAALRVNLGLFAEMGFADVTVSGSDAEDFMTFETPVYYATFEVSGLVQGVTGRGAFGTVDEYETDGEVEYQTFRQ